MEEINERILYVVENSGMKRVDVGKLCGVTGQHISRLCAGAVSPSNAFIMTFCRAMDIDETWLRTGEGDPTPDRTLMEDVSRMIADIMQNESVAEQQEISRALLRMGPTGWHHLLRFLTEFQKTMEDNNGKR